MAKVIKRDGREVEFNTNKIVSAIVKAMKASESYNLELANKIANEIANKNCNMSVDDIQDAVEKKLMSSNCKDAAKAFILYRETRTAVRNKNSKVAKAFWKRNNATGIENANANVDERSFSGREKECSSDIQKMMALDYNMSKPVSRAHQDGYIYHHDLDKYNLGAHNCLQIDFSEVFTYGFKTRNGDVRPPTSFATACQLVAVVFQCQSQVQYGGVGSIHLDYDLARFVTLSFIKHFKHGLKYIEKLHPEYINNLPIDFGIGHELTARWKDVNRYAMDMLEREGRQAAQGLYHNLNTLESRQGSQVPFTSVNCGRDTSTEGRMVTKWIMQASLDGIGKHHLTSIFPISIFQYKSGCNASVDDPNYDLKQLALKSMSKRIYPNWCNCDWSEAHEDLSDPDTYFSTMGCRTMIGYDRNGLDYVRTGRGNNTPITIILPKFGIEYGICTGERDVADITGFWKAFEKILKLVEEAHLERFEIMKNQPPQAAPFMYLNNTIQGARDCQQNVYEALKHNTFAIGYIGIAEMCQALFGVNHVHSTQAHAFALSIVKRINEFAAEASERNSLNFSCYATPAEGLCRTALVKLQEQYGVIPNVTDRDYLTNSHHVPVWEKVTIYQKLQLEAPFCKYPTGGCITYVELDSMFVKNLEAIEALIDYAFQGLDIPYLAFNFPIDSCLDCGYQGEFNQECPECNSKNIQQLRRVTGYLTTDWHNFNDGKQAETQDRVKHTLS